VNTFVLIGWLDSSINKIDIKYLITEKKKAQACHKHKTSTAIGHSLASIKYTSYHYYI